MTVDELLQKGIQAAKAGQSTEAWHVLRQVVEREPRNEQAWLWLSGVVETDEQRMTCLQNVLAINPHNQAAWRGLDTLKQKAAPIKPLPETLPPAVSEKPKSVLSRETMGCSIALLIVLVVIIALALNVDSLSRKSKVSATPTLSPSIGKQGILHVEDGASSHWVAADEETTEKLLDAINAKDDYGLSELLLTEQVFSVKDGTKVLIIDEALFKIQIRILEGPYAGQSGWVPHKWVVVE